MSSYIVKNSKDEKKIIKVEAENYYTFSPKSAARENITSITIYDYEKISKIILKKLMIKYQHILDIISSLQDDSDNSETDYALCLDEITKLYEMLEYKYKKYIKRDLYNKFIEDLSKLKEFIVVGLEEKTSIRR